MKRKFEYEGVVSEVLDGDTVVFSEIDLGFNTILKNEKFRLALINAPELTSKNEQEKAAALAAKTRLSDLVLGKKVIIQTTKNKKGQENKEKYGRYLCEIVLDLNGVSVNVNNLLLKEGLAKSY